jgi:excisionase family DNA binding protein
MDLFEQYPDVVNVKELQEMLGVGRNAVYSLLRDKEIRAVRYGARYIIPKLSVIEYLLDKRLY